MQDYKPFILFLLAAIFGFLIYIVISQTIALISGNPILMLMVFTIAAVVMYILLQFLTNMSKNTSGG